MEQFHWFLNDSTLKEIHLQGRLFTLSNEQLHLTLERIDRAFISLEWDDLFPCCELHSLSSLCSNHSPLLLKTDNSFINRKRFYFRSFWTLFPGFKEVVEWAWHCSLRDANPFGQLDYLLCNIAQVLESWSTHSIGSIHTQASNGNEVVFRLESGGVRQHLATHEEELRQHLKLKSLSLSSLQRTIPQQESRLFWLNEGDAPNQILPCASKPLQVQELHPFF
jgi:hypothetical protein